MTEAVSTAGIYMQDWARSVADLASEGGQIPLANVRSLLDACGSGRLKTSTRSPGELTGELEYHVSCLCYRNYGELTPSSFRPALFAQRTSCVVWGHW